MDSIPIGLMCFSIWVGFNFVFLAFLFLSIFVFDLVPSRQNNNNNNKFILVGNLKHPKV